MLWRDPADDSESEDERRRLRVFDFFFFGRPRAKSEEHSEDTRGTGMPEHRKSDEGGPMERGEEYAVACVGNPPLAAENASSPVG